MLYSSYKITSYLLSVTKNSKMKYLKIYTILNFTFNIAKNKLIFVYLNIKICNNYSPNSSFWRYHRPFSTYLNLFLNFEVNRF